MLDVMPCSSSSMVSQGLLLSMTIFLSLTTKRKRRFLLFAKQRVHRMKSGYNLSRRPGQSFVEVMKFQKWEDAMNFCKILTARLLRFTGQKIIKHRNNVINFLS
jgi:hypothetical protein